MGSSLLAVVAVTLLACSPARMGFDASPLPDVPGVADVAMDVPQDNVDVANMDAHDAADTGACVAATCDNQCTSRGCAAGVCSSATCMCRACPDVLTPVDVQYESSVQSCTSNTNCPPSEFCSGSTCAGTGFCFPRGQADASTCLPDPHPSCGCDGVSYPSVCARLSAGVRQNPAGCNGDASVDAPTDAHATDGSIDASGG